jgi:hypothetical protein
VEYGLGMGPSDVGSEQVGEVALYVIVQVSSVVDAIARYSAYCLSFVGNSSMGCFLLGFLKCRLGVMVVSAGEEIMRVFVCVRAGW